MQFEANTSQFFDCLVVLTDCSDAKMSRSGDFLCRQMTDKTDCFTLAHARRVIIVCAYNHYTKVCLYVWLLRERLINNYRHKH